MIVWNGKQKLRRYLKMATKPKIYLAGKITGLHVRDYTESFNYWKKFFTKKGYKVVSPIDLPHNHPPDWKEFMKEYIKAMVDCDCLFAMNNWLDSKGARLEVEIARGLEIEIFWEDKIKEYAW